VILLNPKFAEPISITLKGYSIQPNHQPVVSSGMITSGPILIFDGVCNLCNRLVIFIVKRDRKTIISFSQLQSESGRILLKKFGLNNGKADSVVYVRGESYYLKSSAILHLLKDLGRGWGVFYGFIIIPAFIRDFFYDIVARTRYRIFGRTDKCMIPSRDIKMRFLDQQ
jgi:predicted DCC family thiol-disulfide oxidoreductase YuxK